MTRGEPGAGARLILVAADGSTRVLTPRFHAACDPDVSFDGKRILFAGQAAEGDRWGIFEMELDGHEARQVTRVAGDCRRPLYASTFYTITEKEPWEQIAFVGTLAGLVSEFGDAPATSLYTCKLDGSALARITYNLSSDYDPAMMADGRLLYAVWNRATFDHGVRGRISLEGINVDGTDRAPFVPDRGGRIKHLPCLAPGGLVLFVESDSLPWDGAGRLAAVETRRPLHTYRAITEARDGLFHSPAPLPDGRILVGWRPAEGSVSNGLYRMDLATRRLELILDDPGFHEIQAKAVHPRPRPDGRSSVVSPEDPLAKLYCMNLYTTEFKDRTWLPPGSVKTLRVVEGIPAEPVANRAAEETPVPAIPQLSPRRILAEVPVKADGSFQVTVPANTPVQLQVLDDRGIALRSCGWIWARSHQAQGCIGCHEDPELTPPNRVPEALRGAAENVAVPIERRTAVSFPRQIAPIVAAKCMPCHQAGGPPPQLDASEVEAGPLTDTRLRRLYEALLTPREPAEDQDHTGLGKYVHPGRSRTSPLVWHIFGQNTAKPWDGNIFRGEARPIPPGNGRCAPLTEDEKRTIARWIDLGAPRDVPARGTSGPEAGPSR
jgi:hypothetical protein